MYYFLTSPIRTHSKQIAIRRKNYKCTIYYC